MRDVFVRRLMELAAADPRIFLVTGDLGFGVLTAYEERFPRQFLNVGVAEQNMTGVATGLALEGRIVFTYSIGNFPTLRCLEQIRNDAAYHGANVKVVSIGGGFSYGALGMSHHATEDLSIMRALAEVTVVSPGDDWETTEATAALAYTPGTCYLRLDKSTAGNTGRAGEVFQLGRARMLRNGSDVTLVATGGILELALRSAEVLARDGVESRVLSMHTVKPLDGDALAAACEQTSALIAIEEHSTSGGLGGAIAEWCLEHGSVPGSFRRVGLRAGYSSIVGSQSYLRERYGLDVAAIVATARDGYAASLERPTRR